MPTVRDRGRLPHWEATDAIYFVTFRLADSLPTPVLRQIELERENLIATALAQGREISASVKAELERVFSEKIESNLDAGAGGCYLANPAAADIVAETVQHFDSTRCNLYAWCVMPNHVHEVFRLLAEHKLAEVLHSWKSYSGKKANRVLGRTGELWQREYYDHLIRSEEEFYRIVGYVLENPRKAGLRDWRWVGTSVKA